MSTNSQRFIMRPTFAGVWMIRDSKDDSVVCIMNKGNRPLEKTEAMTKVMLEALNQAVHPRNVKRDDEHHKAES